MTPRTDPPPVFTREAVREVDRRCIEDFHIPGVVLMENAASALAQRALAMLGAHDLDSACVLAGPGNNGGDGFALARKLHNAGVPAVIALLADPDRIAGDARTNLDIARAMRLTLLGIESHDQLDSARDAAGRSPLLVDALLGTGLTCAPRERIADAIAWCNNQRSPVLAVDLPSGLDCDTGRPLGETIRANHTVTFVGWKQGFTNPDARQYTGDITVGDIGAPIELIRALTRATTWLR
ncbi:MAG: NAD(P)H-hydrate epimerase [Phycisphaeraceae bacterium]|nr:NAD(P)H-hydrate epimerase [Phycisphaeraceae bacterium]